MPQRHGGRNFVYILPTWPTGARKTFLQLALPNPQPRHACVRPHSIPPRGLNPCPEYNSLFTNHKPPLPSHLSPINPPLHLPQRSLAEGGSPHCSSISSQTGAIFSRPCRS